MANVAEVTIKGKNSATKTPSAGAASFTVALNHNDARSYLCIVNNAAETCRAVVDEGDGALSVLGDLTVDIDSGDVGVISFVNSMRFKTMTTQSIAVALNDTSDQALTATPLALISMFAIQG